MLREVHGWLEQRIEDLNEIYSERSDSVKLIFSYAVKSEAGLTWPEYTNIIKKKGIPEMDYEPGSIADQIASKALEKGKSEIALKLIAKGMSDEEIFEITGLPLNTIAELRQQP